MLTMFLRTGADADVRPTASG